MKYKVTLRGKVYEVEVERGEAILLDEYEAAAPAPAAPAAPAPEAAPAAAPAPAAPAPTTMVAGTPVNAPMPGNILDVRVNAGDKVTEGQILCILEAMKMENEIVAPSDGTVAQVVTAKGAVVDTGDPLIILG